MTKLQYKSNKINLHLPTTWIYVIEYNDKPNNKMCKCLPNVFPKNTTWEHFTLQKSCETTISSKHFWFHPEFLCYFLYFLNVGVTSTLSCNLICCGNTAQELSTRVWVWKVAGLIPNQLIPKVTVNSLAWYLVVVVQ